jgi:hypothetical protein
VAEQAYAAALALAHRLECQLDSVRMGLRLERVPRQADAGGALTLLGRIRWLGDKCRRAEQRADRLERELKRLRGEFTAPRRASGPTVLPGQLDVDERDSASQNADTTRTRSPHPGGLQVSYRKAVEVVAYELASMLRAHLGYDGTNEYPRARAERVLAEALSERQRERVQR